MVPARVLRTALPFAVLLQTVAAPELAAAQSTPSAQAEADATPPEAVEFYRQAREHYEAGQYRQASESLERALVLDPDSPTLVYNLARVYELLGELDRALEMYERYQQLLPQQQAREQDRAESSIRRLRGAQESGQLAVPEAPREVEALRQLPGVVLVRERGVADSLFTAVLVVGASSLAAGGVLGSLALVEHGNAQGFVVGADGTVAQRDDAWGRAEALGIAADITLVAGGAAVIAAGLLYFLREHTVERAPVGVREGEEAAATDLRLDLALGPSGARMLMAGAF